ncbi:MAG: dTDP-Rha--alpha-D-GlcNAc-pyrophosphate polyprenol alpha-3-L-rhamnosyltransferase [Flavobacteriaceae bacterium]|nr:dTDP-Rha--alpha-D-GlcNAc-pyrophosphate polyprenol alpha-3-L-rhamnosyltransferase [Flavobacteriaceae bacterium]
MKVAVIILNWNGKKLLERFLPSVVNFSKGNDIYVADNGSTDDSIAFIEKKYPQIHIVKLVKNYGYAEGYNEAVKDINADVFCFLNSDVRVTQDWINPVVKVFETQPEISIIQPKILDEKKPHKFEYAGAAGGFIDQLGYPYCRGRIFHTVEEDLGQYDNNYPLFWASGACFFIRRTTFNDLDGFDAKFFAHMEEIDLCWRAHHQGQKVFYVGNSTVFHLGGQSLKASSPKKTFLNFRNNLLTITKNSNHYLFLIIFIRLILDGFAGVRLLLMGRFKSFIAVVKAHLSFYSLLPYALTYRYKNKNRIQHNGINSIVLKYYVLKIKSFKKLNTH